MHIPSRCRLNWRLLWNTLFYNYVFDVLPGTPLLSESNIRLFPNIRWNTVNEFVIKTWITILISVLKIILLKNVLKKLSVWLLQYGQISQVNRNLTNSPADSTKNSNTRQNFPHFPFAYACNGKLLSVLPYCLLIKGETLVISCVSKTTSCKLWHIQAVHNTTPP